jgi:hypothetical protein
LAAPPTTGGSEEGLNTTDQDLSHPGKRTRSKRGRGPREPPKETTKSSKDPATQSDSRDGSDGEENTRRGAQDDNTLRVGIARRPTCADVGQHRHDPHFGFAQIKTELRNGKFPGKGIPIHHKFTSFLQTLNQSRKQQPLTADSNTRDLVNRERKGAGMFFAHLGCNTSSSADKTLPAWNSFDLDHLPVVESMARLMLHKEGVAVLVHGFQLKQIKHIFDQFRGSKNRQWTLPETFFVWNDTPRYRHAGTKEVPRTLNPILTDSFSPGHALLDHFY